MNRFVLEKEIWYTQIDNKIAPKYSCFPTSMSMAIAYCLQEIGTDKTTIGCNKDEQLEDYINEIAMNPTTMKWIKNNVAKYGKWMIQTTPRENFYVEEYIFNLLMNPLGYKATFSAKGSFFEFCNLMEKHKLPIILKGKYKPETPINGHITCGIGFDREKKTFIINDPYGNALTKYKDNKGEKVEYPCNHWFINEDGYIYYIYIMKTI